MNEDYPVIESPSAKQVYQPDATIWSNFHTQAGDVLCWEQLWWVAHLPRGSQLPSSL